MKMGMPFTMKHQKPIFFIFSRRHCMDPVIFCYDLSNIVFGATTIVKLKENF